jgi:hypothetical protein
MFARSSLVALLLASAATVIACQAPVGDEAGDGNSAVMGTEGKPVLSQAADKLIDIPAYFGVPKAAVQTSVELPRTEFPTLWNPATDTTSSGLRILAIKQELAKSQVLPVEPDPSDAAAVEAYKTKKRAIALANDDGKKLARTKMSEKLAQAGVLQDGDIVLTFRPEMAKTIPYIHVQMGTTHASVTYLKEDENGKSAWNVDSPMKGNDYVGQFDAAHFIGGVDSKNDPDLGTDAIHIIRPRAMKDAGRRAQHRQWASMIAKNRGNQQIAFNGNYNAPSSPTKELARKNITNIGKLALGIGGQNMSIYCSEFAWHMLALSNCSEQQIRAAGPEGAQCAEDGIVFEQMRLAEIRGEGIGLTEGPLQGILAAPAGERQKMLASIFENDGNVKLSPGHQAMAVETAPLMAPLEMYYGIRAAGGSLSPDLMAKADAVIASKPLNYSPTAFIAQAARTDADRPMDYVGTVVFVDNDADFAKAKLLAR